jgi:N-acetylglucosamine malate deacetylase 1
MIERVLVVAPHPDDETLGCGGTLLRLAQSGAQLAWLIVTGISREGGFSDERVKERDAEIEKVSSLFGFKEVFNLKLPTRQLDRVPIQDLMGQFSAVYRSFKPEQVFLPNRSDVHTDHRIVFDAGAACSKWFRFPSVQRVLAYETLSETDFALGESSIFRPNYFVDISDHLERKLEILQLYKSEIDEFPFPRSVEAVRALARLRGSTAGCKAAEAFQLLRERI